MDFQSIALPTELSGHVFYKDELRGQDLNLRPSGYEPDELPDCSTPRRFLLTIIFDFHQNINSFNGRRWIRTTEASCSRFTVCPLWPLGNPPIFILNCSLFSEADDRTRTDNLLITNQLLCQLSHIGIEWGLQGSNL